MASKLAQQMGTIAKALTAILHEDAERAKDAENTLDKFYRITTDALVDNVFRAYSEKDRAKHIGAIFKTVRQNVADWMEEQHPESFAIFFTNVDEAWDDMDSDERKATFTDKRGYRRSLYNSGAMDNDADYTAADYHRFVDQSYSRTQEMKYLVAEYYGDNSRDVRKAIKAFRNGDISATGLRDAVELARKGESRAPLSPVEKAAKRWDAWAGVVRSEERTDKERAQMIAHATAALASLKKELKS